MVNSIMTSMGSSIDSYIQSIESISKNYQEDGKEMVHSIITRIGNGIDSYAQSIESISNNYQKSIVETVSRVKEKTISVLEIIPSFLIGIENEIANTLLELASKIHATFENYQYHLVYIGLAAAQLAFNPHYFTVGTVAGILGHFSLNLVPQEIIYRQKSHTSSHLCERGFEAAIVQSAFLATTATCEIAQTISNIHYPSNETTTTAILSGVFFGVFLSSTADKFFNNTLSE